MKLVTPIPKQTPGETPGMTSGQTPEAKRKFFIK